MSMQPRPWPEVPEQTARMARAASRRGNLAMRIRDELEQVYADDEFTAAFGVRGRPGISPAQLMMASVLQFTENLTDRQAAEAVRDRITWKYALGLELEDPGFDASVLSEFRSRLVAGNLTSLALDALLQRLADAGLLTGGGRVRTDSTHVLGTIRELNRLELAGETLRAALEALAVTDPRWLSTAIDASWQDIYGARIDAMRLPEGRAKRADLHLQYGRDGYHLLDQIHAPTAPSWLIELPAVEALRRIWVQQFYRQIDSAHDGTDSAHEDRQEVRRRQAAPEGEGMPPVRDLVVSPYDLDARCGKKRETTWKGYKVHFTETCDPPQAQAEPGRGERPNVITNVLTTTAAVTDAEMTTTIHQHLAGKDLIPGEHIVDAGYPSIDILLHAQQTWGLTLTGPVQLNRSAQARAANGYDSTAFSIDFAAQHATCPQNVRSRAWKPGRDRTRDLIVVSWSNTDCKPCPAKDLCTRAAHRNLTIRPRQQHEGLAAVRAEQATPEWKKRYAIRAGIEGTMRQSTHVTGIRRARYLGLPKTSLEHTFAAAAINLIRLDAYWSGHPLDRTRTTHLARLDFTQAA